MSPVGNYLLGNRAGPSCHISSLTHEMCHLAEREIPKLLEKPNCSWGFTYGKYWECLGQSGYESQTDQSVLREARVWAYQWSLHQTLGIPIEDDEEDNNIEGLVSSAVYMDAFFIYRNKRIDPNLEFRQKEKEGLKALAAEVQELSRTRFTFDDFKRNWNEHMAALKAA